MLFDKVLTNYGGYYSTQTSSFICPVDAIYMFVLVINVHQTNAFVRIMRNDVRLISARARAFDVDFNHGTNMVVKECLAGDVVWPLLDWIFGANDVDAKSYYCDTTFSGFLLKTL